MLRRRNEVAYRISSVESGWRFLLGSDRRRWQFCRQLRRAAQSGSRASHQSRKIVAAPARATEARLHQRYLRSGSVGSSTPVPRSALSRPHVVSRISSVSAAGTRDDSGIPADCTVSSNRSSERLGTVSERSGASPFHATVTRKIWIRWTTDLKFRIARRKLSDFSVWKKTIYCFVKWCTETTNESSSVTFDVVVW